MNTEKVISLLENPSDDTLSDLLQDDSLTFCVDWRESDEVIAEYCESILHTGKLSGELVDADHEEGYDVYVEYGERRLRVPLKYSGEDRHITLCALNRVLAGEYEIRLCVDSNGSDSLLFIPLPCEEWASLERRFGKAVEKRLYRLSDRPNVFTDVLPF